jgi:hypothetical protein
MSNTETLYNEKLSILQTLELKHASAPEQRSASWKEMLKYTVGGSDQAKIFGKSQYGHEADIVAEKSGLLPPFKGNLYTRFGTIMEKPLERLMEILLDCTMRNFGAVNGPVEHQRYSPDGITIATIKWKGIIRTLLILMEYKNPFTRIPNGAIPDDYVHQIKTGLCTFPELDLCLFTNAMSRICKRGDYECSSAYNTSIHNKDEKNGFEPCDPLAMGTILFYLNRKQRKQLDFFNHKDSKLDKEDSASCSEDDTFHFSNHGGFLSLKQLLDIYRDDNIDLTELASTTDITTDDIESKMIDFGGCSFQQVNMLLEMMEKKLITACYLSPCIFRRNLKRVRFLRKQESPMIKEYDDEAWEARTERLKKKEETKIIEACKEIVLENKHHLLIGLLSWKMFKLDIIPYENEDPEYLQRQAPKIKKLMHIIEKIKESSRPWETLHRYYPTRFKTHNDDNDETAANHQEVQEELHKKALSDFAKDD